MPGIDRDHVIAALQEIFERKIARAHVDRRSADHRDRLYTVENLADVLVGVGVVIHSNLSTPSLRANGSRERAPDDKLREAIHSHTQRMDCFVASLLAMTKHADFQITV